MRSAIPWTRSEDESQPRSATDSCTRRKEGRRPHEEIAYGSLERSTRLPMEKADSQKITAHYDNGRLEIIMPTPKEFAPKIPVEASA